jgi:hypothetical protein
LIFVSSVFISVFTWVAKLQMPDSHFLVGAGYALHTFPSVPSTTLSQPSQFHWEG